MVSIEYIAGFFDGEGTVQIRKANDRTNGRYWLDCSICNTNRTIIEEIRNNIGGSIRYYVSKNKNRRDHYRLCFTQVPTYNLMKILLPYLIVKKKQAEIAIRFRDGLRKYGSGLARTSEEVGFQENCYQEMTTANKRGVIINVS